MKLYYCMTLIVIFLSTPTAFSQQSSNDTDYGYNYSQAEKFLPDNVIPIFYNMTVAPNWIDGTDKFWYINTARQGKEVVLVDAANATKILVFNQGTLAQVIASTSSIEVNPVNLPFSNMSFLGTTVEFSALNKTWQYDLKSHSIIEAKSKRALGRSFTPKRYNELLAFSEISAIKSTDTGEMLSPDNTLAIFVHDHNLWIKEIATGRKYPLTSNGSQDYAYAERSDTVLHPVSQARLNETSLPYAVWSPDSRRIATFRMDQRNVTPLHLLEYVPDSNSRPKSWMYKFAMPDEKRVPVYEPVVIDVLEKKVIPVSYEPQPEVSLMDTDEDVLQWWRDDGRAIYSLFADRGEKALHLLETNPYDGQTREILNESGPTYIEANLDYASLPNAKVLKNGDIIWFSEKNGYGHLYLFDKDGKQKSAITSGNWSVRKLLFVDENNSLVYITAEGREAGRDPYYRHLYKVNLNGTGLTLLTPENADHNIQVSPKGTAFVDTYSRADLPPVTVLRDPNGNVTLTLEEGDIGDLIEMGWKSPENFSIKALDGKTDLYGLLIKPTDFNASNKYPIVEEVYPGPWTIVTAKSFPGDMSWVNKIFWRGQALSELGFIVVLMDGPGTPYRSKEFHDASYGRLGDAGGLSDHINALKKLAEDRPYMDLNRVGMFGHSAGGFMTAQALLTYPAFYKVGVASAGDYDSRFYGA